MEFKTLSVHFEGSIAWLKLNRPDKANAMSLLMWEELPRAAAWIDSQAQVRAVILCGAGKNFCAGLDLDVFGHLQEMAQEQACQGRGSEAIFRFVRSAQQGINSLEQIRVPIIAAVHGACFGGGVDIIAACDLRCASSSARFCIKEVDLAIVPDVGTLQRLRHVIGLSKLSELTYTADVLDASMATAIGLVGSVFETEDALWAGAEALARKIATKSPLAVRGIKHNLLFARDHTVADSLQYTAAWNASMLRSQDVSEATAAFKQKRTPSFPD